MHAYCVWNLIQLYFTQIPVITLQRITTILDGGILSMIIHTSTSTRSFIVVVYRTQTPMGDGRGMVHL